MSISGRSVRLRQGHMVSNAIDHGVAAMANL
jgi:hypothetical protein